MSIQSNRNLNQNCQIIPAVTFPKELDSQTHERTLSNFMHVSEDSLESNCPVCLREPDATTAGTP